jgi:glucan phosphoethanolaminetransferase (alkaline phosphatase superfamily)
VNTSLYKLIWRFIAIICILAWGMVLISDISLFKQGVQIQEHKFFTPFFGIVASGITMLVLAVLVVFPLEFRPYAILCCIWGLFNLIDGGSTSGLLMYLLGLTFAFHAKFFKKYREVKSIFVAIFPIAAIISQSRFGADQIILSLLNFLAIILIFGLAFLLFYPDIRKLGKKNILDSNVIFLPAEQFSERDLRFIKKVQEGEKYASIAREEDMGESTLKSKMKIIYNNLDVYDRVSFMSTYAGYKFKLEPSSKNLYESFVSRKNEKEE